MGGTSSSTVADSVENQSKEVSAQNFGLLNVSSESMGTDVNALEVVTFVIMLAGAAIFIKYLCARRRRRRLAELSSHLQQQQGINMPNIPPDYPQPMMPVVRPNVARLLLVAPPPPPTYQPALAEAEKYNI